MARARFSWVREPLSLPNPARQNEIVTEANSATNGARPGIIVAHTSDLHVGGRWTPDAELQNLRAVLEAVQETSADVLILAGDVFDTNRTPLPVV